MTATAVAAQRDVQRLLGTRDLPGMLVAASRDPDAKLTFVVTAPSASRDHRHLGERFAVKIPTTTAAGAAVEHEGRMLVELRRTRLGQLQETLPRYVGNTRYEGRPVLVSTALEGVPMSVAYHTLGHTATPWAVRADFARAATWLREFQQGTTSGDARVTWAAEVADVVRRRWDGHPASTAALERLRRADRELRTQTSPITAVHGDFWFGNVLVRGPQVSGVVDWEAGATSGWPLRDLARFAVSYSLYLDRHTRPGRRVLGHPRLRRTGVAPGVSYALEDDGWLPRLVRGFLADGLQALGLSRGSWYDVALTGIGEVAATANDDRFGETHLQLLARLPLYARRHRT